MSSVNMTTNSSPSTVMSRYNYKGIRNGWWCAIVVNIVFISIVRTQNSQQTVDEWCQQRFGPNKKSCYDLLQRWCTQTQDNDQSKTRPQICDSFGGGKGNGPQQVQQQALPQPPPRQLPQPQPQVQPQPQPQPIPDGSSTGGGPKAQKADPSVLNSLNAVFNKLAEGKRQLEDTIKVFSDPIRAAAASPLWPQRTKNVNSKATRTELSQNDPSKYFHGDVDLTPLQANSLIEWARSQDNQPTLESSGRKKRKVGKPPSFELWNINPIPYDFDRRVPTATRGVIKQAIHMWEANTCRRWREGGPGQNRVQFVDADGCSSFIGKAGGTQEISLSTPGCDIPGIAAHEIGHSLGFFHEQSRPDQSDNVRINYKNIRVAVRNNFVPMKDRDVNYYNEPYDFGSVMHYDGLTRGFTFNEDEHSIITLDPLYQNTIGQRVQPSFVDYKQVNSAYCTSVCGGLNPHGCQYGGYADPNSCGKCRCPSGFGGSRCETASSSTIPNCGGVLQASKTPQFFTTPNYPHSYPINGDCAWHIRAPDPRSRVYIEFVDRFGFPCEDTCASSYAEVKRGPVFERTGYRLCCNAAPNGQPLISEGPLMVIMLSTHGDSGSGFKVRYYTDAGTGSVPPPIATPRPGGGGTRKPLPPPVGKPRPVGPTPAPGPAPTQPPGCNCGEWGRWSGCSQKCGGCGYIRRKRQCNKSDCFDIEKKHCNFAKCAEDTNIQWTNNEVNFLFDGCCIGMVATNGVCSGLNTAFTQLISSFLPSGGRR